VLDGNLLVQPVEEPTQPARSPELESGSRLPQPRRPRPHRRRRTLDPRRPCRSGPARSPSRELPNYLARSVRLIRPKIDCSVPGGDVSDRQHRDGDMGIITDNGTASVPDPDPSPT
jgi:hypothetical protein